MPLIICPPYQDIILDDPYKNNVSASLNFQGTPGSTYITDVNGKPYNNHGVVLSSANSKFGGTSAYFNGSSYMETPSSPELVFDDLNWTIDFWFSPNSVTNQYQEIVTKGAGLQIYMQYDKIMLALSANNTTSYFVLTPFGTLQAGSWFHIAVQKNSRVYTGFLNGVGTSLGVSSLNCDTGTSSFVVGSYLAGYYPILGYMSNLRVTKGAARYPGDFTPPTS